MAGQGKKPRRADARAAVSRNLVWVRELFDLNRKRFADGFGVGDTLWRRWEMGRNYPDPDVMVALCDRFGATMDFLYRSRMSGLPEWMIRALTEKHPELRAAVGVACGSESSGGAAFVHFVAHGIDQPRAGRRPRRKTGLDPGREPPSPGVLIAAAGLNDWAGEGGPILGAAAAPDQPQAGRRPRKARLKPKVAQVARE